MNPNSNLIFYKIAAVFIFAVIIALLVAITVATVTDTDEPEPPALSINEDASPSRPDEDEIIPEDTTEADTTDTTDEVTTETAPPETTTPETADTPPSPPVSVPNANTSEEWAATLAKYPDTVLSETADAGQGYIDKLVFLGDSTTYGLKRYKMLSGGLETNQVWTPYNGTLTLSTVSFATIVYPETGDQITIKEAVTLKKPEYLVITLGVNGISFMDEDTFKPEYRNLVNMVKEVSPETKIICQSIFPVARSYKSLKSINNDKIRAANRWILEVAHETGTKFLDTYSVMCDEEGWLPENHQNGDGLHPTPEAYTLELNNLRTHAYID